MDPKVTVTCQGCGLPVLASAIAGCVDKVWHTDCFQQEQAKPAREDAPRSTIARGVATALLLVFTLLGVSPAFAQEVQSVGSGLPPVGTPGQVLTVSGGAWVPATPAGAGLGDASTNTAVSVDGEMPLFSGTAGKTFKRASGNGFTVFTSGVPTFFTPASGIQTFLTTPSSANFLAAMTTKTGTGSVVFGTSPALITPDLGVPTAITLTNATGCAVSTCVGGLGANVATALGTFSSANMRAAASDESGTGAWLFANGNIGAATMTSLNKVAITAPATSATIVPIDGVTWTGPAVSGTTAILGANVFTGRQDSSGAASTAPSKAGTAAPGTCTVGDQFFDTDATAGSNLYGCTATNTWTLQAGGGGGAGDALVANPLSQFANTTSAQFFGIITDETGGSGVAVRSNSPVIVTPTIASFANATHNHSNAAGGGSLSSSAFPSAITENALTTTTTVAVYGGAYQVSCTVACTVELPTVTASTGETIAVCVDDASAGLVTLDGNGAQTINGLTTRVMVPGECANLIVRAGEWKKTSGKQANLTATASRIMSDTSALAAATPTIIGMDTLESGSSFMWDSGNGRLKAIRPGLYRVTISLFFEGVTPGDRIVVVTTKSGVSTAALGYFDESAGRTEIGSLFSFPDITLAIGDYVQAVVQDEMGGARVNGDSSLPGRISLTEVSTW